MRMLFVSIVVAPLMMIGALPAAQSISSDARIRLANGGPTANRDPYNQNAPDALLEWQKKLDDFTEKAKAKLLEEGNAVGDELNAAWIKTVAGRAQAAGREREQLEEHNDLLREGIAWDNGGLGENAAR
jgi:hypothetical protein